MSWSTTTYRPAQVAGPNMAVPMSRSRQSASTRPIYIKGGVISQASGSATFEQGKSKVICSVYGPRARKNVGGRAEFTGSGALDAQVTYAAFSQREGKEKDDRKSRELSRVVQSALEGCVQLHRFPKSVIDVYICILEDDGSAIACCISCASIALANAGIEMYDIVPCCVLAMMPDGNVFVDPDKDEENSANVLCAIGCMPNANNVTCLEIECVNNGISEEAIGNLVSTGWATCLSLARVMRNVLKEEATASVKISD